MCGMFNGCNTQLGSQVSVVYLPKGPATEHIISFNCLSVAKLFTSGAVTGKETSNLQRLFLIGS